MPETQSQPTILVVEDETLVRIHGADLLEDAGYQVIEAADAEEALSILSQHETIHLMFSDIDMPGSMDGLDLARRVHERWPHIRLLLTSGQHHLRDDQIPDAGQFLRKPWSQEGLVNQVRELLKA